MGSKAPRRHHRTRRVFLAAFGDGPWPCAYCGTSVLTLGQLSDQGVVHHHDENPLNDDPENLQVMHHRCHVQHHRSGHPRPEIGEQLRVAWAEGRRVEHTQTSETRLKIAETLRGRPCPPEVIAKYSAKLRGQKRSEETKAKLRAAWVRRKARMQAQALTQEKN